MHIIRACEIVERCPCVNFPAAIMAWLKEYPNNGSANTLTVTALCVLGISLLHFHYQECKSELNIHTLPESCACSPLFLGPVCDLPSISVCTRNKVCWFSPVLHPQSLTQQLDIVFNHADSQAGLRGRAPVISLSTVIKTKGVPVSEDWALKLKVKGRDTIVSHPSCPSWLLRNVGRRSNSIRARRYLGTWYSSA